MPAAPGPARSGSSKERSALSGDGGRDPAARAQSIAEEQLLGMIICTSTRAGNGRRTVSVAVGEKSRSFRRCRQRAVPRRSDRSRSVHASCTRLGRSGRTSLAGGESSTDLASDDGARVGERSHIRASTGRQSSSPTQRRGQVRTMSPEGRDSVGTRWGPTSPPSSAIPGAVPAQFGRPGRRSSSSVGRRALGFRVSPREPLS